MAFRVVTGVPKARTLDVDDQGDVAAFEDVLGVCLEDVLRYLDIDIVGELMMVSKRIHNLVVTCEILVESLGYECKQDVCMVQLYHALQPRKEGTFGEGALLPEGETCLTGGKFA